MLDAERYVCVVYHYHVVITLILESETQAGRTDHYNLLTPRSSFLLPYPPPRLGIFSALDQRFWVLPAGQVNWLEYIHFFFQPHSQFLVIWIETIRDNPHSCRWILSHSSFSSLSYLSYWLRVFFCIAEHTKIPSLTSLPTEILASFFEELE